jgi:hypothetical protein
MKSRCLQNVTITLDEGTLAEARVRAAERNMSLSRYVGEVLREKSRYSRAYEEAMRAALAEKPWPLKGPPQRYPTREELYDRPVLRRR